VHNLIRALKYLLPLKWHLLALIVASALFSAVQAYGILLLRDGVDSAFKSAARKSESSAETREVRVRILGQDANGRTQYLLDGTRACDGDAALIAALDSADTGRKPAPAEADDLRIGVSGPDKDGRTTYVLNDKNYKDSQALLRRLDKIRSSRFDSTDPATKLWIIGGLLMLVAFSRGLLSYVQAYLASYLANRVTRTAQNRVMERLVFMPLSFFNSQRTGELLSRMGLDASALRKTVKLAADVVKEPLILLGAIGVVFYMNWRLALIGFIGFPLALWPMIVLSRKMRKASRRSREKAADLSSLMLQIFGGIRLVRAYGQEKAEHSRYFKNNQELFRQEMKATRARALTRPVVEVLSSLGLAAAVVAGGMMIINGSVEPSDIVAFLAALISMYSPAKALAKDNEDIQEVIPGAERFFHLVDAPNDMVDAPDAVDAPPAFQAVAVKGLTFSYVPEAPVLRDISLSIRAGETVALVGPTGAGKSTLADLVCRFYDPQKGSVEMDGIDLRRFRQRSYYNKLAIVPQEPFLFNDTIRANILYGKPGASEAEIEAAARAAAIHDEILALPQGYDTVVGERGTKLSGGQRQRVSIARALLRNAPILILDEATSSLDSASEQLVQQAIERLLAGRTTLVIAHRFSTIRHADKIVVLVDGCIEDAGRHDELLARSPTYRRLWEMQASGPDGPPDD
jgi:subfamily B ATP-binding cassette protein MsbA